MKHIAKPGLPPFKKTPGASKTICKPLKASV